MRHFQGCQFKKSDARDNHASLNQIWLPTRVNQRVKSFFTRVKITCKFYATVLLHPPRRDLPPPSMWGNKIWNIFRYEDTPNPKNTMKLKFKK